MTHKERLELTMAIARIIVSGVILLLGAVCIWRADQSLQKVGIGFVGMVAGYWLR